MVEVEPRKCGCRETGDNDVAFKVLYCGICHSDLHMLKNEWGNTIYPIVPGYVSFSVYRFESVPFKIDNDVLSFKCGGYWFGFAGMKSRVR